ncbi:MAG TPA: RidA family protein [Thermoanaerobaculia bacterium]|nr:RidA family protein [Thermoanaerobaculia bacterium]
MSYRFDSMSRSTRAARALASAAVLVCAVVALGLVDATPAAAQSPEERLGALGIELPAPSAPVANYVRAVTTGNLVFLAGHVPRDANGEIVRGKLGADLDVEQGAAAARLAAIALLASLKAEIGSLDRVVRVVKVTGMVNSSPEFDQQPAVINGCSDLLVEVFGERGKHARSAVGMSSLPLQAVVEIEMIVEISG